MDNFNIISFNDIIPEGWVILKKGTTPESRALIIDTLTDMNNHCMPNGLTWVEYKGVDITSIAWINIETMEWHNSDGGDWYLLLVFEEPNENTEKFFNQGWVRDNGEELKKIFDFDNLALKGYLPFQFL